MELIGKVLWWSDRDQNGIIIDPNGNEFYFDRSVLDSKSLKNIKRNSFVTFNFSKSITDCLCARNVKIPLASKRKSIERSVLKQASINI